LGSRFGVHENLNSPVKFNIDNSKRAIICKKIHLPTSFLGSVH